MDEGIVVLRRGHLVKHKVFLKSPCGSAWYIPLRCYICLKGDAIPSLLRLELKCPRRSETRILKLFGYIDTGRI